MEEAHEYVEGSIFRVKLRNFLTYNDAEFYPGPRLNVILGPNGTGKSSIVCALCVGLGASTKVSVVFAWYVEPFYPVKILGRAEKLSQYVKHEKPYAYTEIELFFSDGNKTVRRDFKRDNNSSRWSINGRGANQGEVRTMRTK